MKKLTKKEVAIIKKAAPKFKEIDNDLTPSKIIAAMEDMLNNQPVLLPGRREI